MALDDDDHCANALDIGDHEAQWLTLFTGPADHPKRRHIDLNEEPKIVVQDIFYNPAKDTKWDLEQLKLQDEKFDGHG
ncbi:TMV resistance protein N-like [Prunus yedoensis var. nudiflora]|uniref:TMV resistance protein N-like n=1 Tax=Prunus yedoensis var. nudiflora TaxID=2094558 RepID=A0A314XUD9_PRUYE|nr:TMV resistance protein N-like [Prunus yedoensis var. nudiflora]